VIDGGQRDITQLAELLHAAVARSEVAVVPTVSIGVATARAGADDVRKVVRRLIARADAAMYRAKNAGGNQTVDAAADDSLSGGLSATD
jgi:GGDEF domain-containing protein